MKNIFRFATLLFLTISIGHAQTTYEDPEGQFVIDLFDELQPQPEIIPPTYSFKNGDYAIALQKNTNSNDVNVAHATAVQILLDGGLKSPKLLGDTKKLLLNGHEAIKSTYQGEYTYEGNTATLKGMTFAIALGDFTLSAITILSNSRFKSSAKDVESTYFSIRKPGQQVTGISQEEIIDFSPDGLVKNEATAPSTESTEVTYEGITLTLPPGWSDQKKSRSDAKSIIGKYKNSDRVAYVGVTGVKGIIWNMKRANELAYQISRDAIQGSELVKSVKIDLKNKKKAFLHVHTGTVVSEGEESNVTISTLAHKVGKWFLVHSLTTLGSSPIPDIENDITAIANSAK